MSTRIAQRMSIGTAISAKGQVLQWCLQSRQVRGGAGRLGRVISSRIKPSTTGGIRINDGHNLTRTRIEIGVMGNDEETRRKCWPVKNGIRNISFVILAVLSAHFTSCADEATAIDREQLAFLKEQHTPLFIKDVLERLGPTEPGNGEPYYRYIVTSGPRASIEFWLRDVPDDRLKNQKNMEVINMEIAMVVEKAVDAKPEIIWPKQLVGTDIDSVLKATWPKIYR
jgi:hypothetical protein